MLVVRVYFIVVDGAFIIDIFISIYGMSGLSNMNRKPRRSATDKVIHIRIDEETHRKLKMHAASSKATIQKLVEDMIRSKYQKMRIGNKDL
jgi:hypothetical protein